MALSEMPASSYPLSRSATPPIMRMLQSADEDGGPHTRVGSGQWVNQTVPLTTNVQNGITTVYVQPQQQMPAQTPANPGTAANCKKRTMVVLGSAAVITVALVLIFTL